MNKNIFKSISLLWLGSILGAVFSFLSQAILARNLGTESYGVFSTAFAMVNLLTPLAVFGVSAYWLKVFGQEGWLAYRWILPSFKFVIFSSFLLIILFNIWGYIGPNDLDTKITITILSFMILGLSIQELFFSRLQLEEEYERYSLWQLFVPSTRLLFIVILFFLGWISLRNVAYVYLFISIVVFIISVISITKMYRGEFRLKGHEHKIDLKEIKNEKVSKLIRGSWVFGASGIFYIIWSQSNVIFLKYVINDHAAGIYSVTVLIINAVCILPTVIYSKYLLPKIHRWAKFDDEKLKLIYYKGNKLMLLLGLLSLISILVFAKWFIINSFGEQYNESASLLVLLSIILPFRFVGHNVGSLLVVNEYMIKKIKVMACIAVLNIILNVIFIPIIGINGVVISSIVCEILLVISYFILVKRIYKY
ncbi:TPA: oligosaccharide flippase family protein [Photobacterium damselae]